MQSWCRNLPYPRHPVLKMTIDVTKLNRSQSITTKAWHKPAEKTLLGWDHLEDYTCTEFTDENPTSLSIQVNSSNLSWWNLDFVEIQMPLRHPFKSPKYPQISELQKIFDTSYLVTLPRSLKILGDIRLGFSKRENNLRYDHDGL